jgi:hypothetical protein
LIYFNIIHEVAIPHFVTFRLFCGVQVKCSCARNYRFKSQYGISLLLHNNRVDLIKDVFICFTTSR